MLLPGKLICIQESDHGFRLRPPMFVCVDDAGGFGFVQQAAVGVEALRRRLPAPSEWRPSRVRFEQRGIAEDLRRFDRAASFLRCRGRRRFSASAGCQSSSKKRMKWWVARIEDVIEKDLNQLAQPEANSRIFVDLKKRGVGLEQVQVGVHGLFLVHVHFAQALVGGEASSRARRFQSSRRCRGSWPADSISSNESHGRVQAVRHRRWRGAYSASA